MNVLQKIWLKDGQTADRDADGTSLTEILFIQFDEIQTDAVQVIKSAEMYVGDPHRNHSELSIESMSPTSESGYEWKISVTYTTEATFDNSNGAVDSSDYKYSVEVNSWSFERVIEYDIKTGEAIANSARDRYDPPPMKVVVYPELVITKKESSANMGRLNDVGKVNSSAVRIAGVDIPAGTAMLAGFEPQTQRDEDGRLYFLNTYVIRINNDTDNDKKPIGFKFHALNAGFNQLVDGKQEPIMINNEVATIPQPLDDTGALLSESDRLNNRYTYRTFTIHAETNFSKFGLPSNFPTY